jgi:hypothetical protein
MMVYEMEERDRAEEVEGGRVEGGGGVVVAPSSRSGTKTSNDPGSAPTLAAASSSARMALSLPSRFFPIFSLCTSAILTRFSSSYRLVSVCCAKIATSR